ncbi:MAG: sigma-70 family RNA polymerase sigma factor [Pirellulaceae bacterium]|nr:sigma-70 family RNA polymerase sigma factor [Planctomycetales bacterium]
MSEPSSELEQRIRQRDSDALAQFLADNQARLRAYIESNMSAALRQKIDADDLVQETGVACLKSLPEIDLAERDLFGWLCQVAQRRIMDAGRKYINSQKRAAKREVPIDAGSKSGTDQAGLINLLVASITSPSQAFSRDQREFKLLAAMQTLPEQSQEVIRMRYVEGLPTKEIADRIGKSDGSVRVMLTRCLKKLEEALSNIDDLH